MTQIRILNSGMWLVTRSILINNMALRDVYQLMNGGRYVFLSWSDDHSYNIGSIFRFVVVQKQLHDDAFIK